MVGPLIIALLEVCCWVVKSSSSCHLTMLQWLSWSVAVVDDVVDSGLTWWHSIVVRPPILVVYNRAYRRYRTGQLASKSSPILLFTMTYEPQASSRCDLLLIDDYFHRKHDVVYSGLVQAQRIRGSTRHTSSKPITVSTPICWGFIDFLG